MTCAGSFVSLCRVQKTVRQKSSVLSAISFTEVLFLTDRTLAIEKFSLLGLEHTQSTTFLPTNLSCFSHSLLHLYLSGKPLQAKEATKLITSLRGGNQASALLQSLRIPVEEMSIGLFDCLYTNLKCLRTLAVAYLPTPGFHEHAEHEVGCLFFLYET